MNQRVHKLVMPNDYTAELRTQDDGWAVTLRLRGEIVRSAWTAGTKVDAIALIGPQARECDIVATLATAETEDECERIYRRWLDQQEDEYGWSHGRKTGGDGAVRRHRGDSGRGRDPRLEGAACRAVG